MISTPNPRSSMTGQGDWLSTECASALEGTVNLQDILMLDNEAYDHFLEMALIILIMMCASLLACYYAYAKGRMDSILELDRILAKSRDFFDPDLGKGKGSGEETRSNDDNDTPVRT